MLTSLLAPLLGFCKCLALWLLGALMAGLTTLFNLLVAGLMALLGPLLALLPAWSPPTFDLSSIGGPLAWANWLFPVDQALAALAVILVFLAIWAVAQIGLRWLKVVA